MSKELDLLVAGYDLCSPLVSFCSFSGRDVPLSYVKLSQSHAIPPIAASPRSSPRDNLISSCTGLANPVAQTFGPAASHVDSISDWKTV